MSESGYRAFGDDYPGVFPHPHPDEELVESLLRAAVQVMEAQHSWPLLDDAAAQFRREPGEADGV
jgi:hypothetical protein